MSKSAEETTPLLEENKAPRQYNFYGPVMYAEGTSSQVQGKGWWVLQWPELCMDEQVALA